jgi:predicted  nucleic acid-binding Zn-ribbon protein
MEIKNKITEEQLKIVKDSQAELNNVLVNIGALESQKHSLLHQLATLNENVENIKKELEKEYGTISINLEDGSYEPITKE